MTRSIAFDGTNLGVLAKEIDNYVSLFEQDITKQPATVRVKYQRINTQVELLQVDVSFEQKINFVQTGPLSILDDAVCEGLLIHIIDGNEPITYSVNKSKSEQKEQCIIVIPFTEQYEINLSKSYKGRWWFFSIPFDWLQQHYMGEKSLPSTSILISELNAYYIQQIDIEEIEFKKRILQHQLLYQTLIELVTDQPFSSGDKGIERSKHYLLANLSKPFPSVRELANIANMSLSGYKSKFLHLTGTTPKAFFIKAQLNLALQLITQGLSIKEIAYQFGYANSSNFINAFKREFGKAPLKYLKKKQDS